MKQTQYEQILNHLRKAGNKGATVRELMQYSNCPWKRIEEMEIMDWSRPGMYILKEEYQHWGYLLEIDRHWKEHNGRKVRLYVLKRVR